MLHLVSHRSAASVHRRSADAASSTDPAVVVSRWSSLPSVVVCRVVTAPEPLSPARPGPVAGEPAVVRADRARPRRPAQQVEPSGAPRCGLRQPSRRPRGGPGRADAVAAPDRSRPGAGPTSTRVGSGRAARAAGAPTGLGPAARGVRRGALAAGPSGGGRRGRRGRARRGGLRAAGGLGAVRRGWHGHRPRRRVPGRAHRRDGRGRPGGGERGGSARPHDRRRRRARRHPRGRRLGRRPSVVVVHVVGRVRHPACGGCRWGRGWPMPSRPPAAPPGRPTSSALNLARVLVDGEQVRVPAPGDPVAPRRHRPAARGQRARGRTGGSQGHPCRSTRPTSPRSTRCPGVGPVLAQRIVDWRTAHGRFTSVDELGEVSGIGEKLLAQLSPLVTL